MSGVNSSDAQTRKVASVLHYFPVFCSWQPHSVHSAGVVQVASMLAAPPASGLPGSSAAVNGADDMTGDLTPEGEALLYVSAEESVEQVRATCQLLA